MKPIKQIAWRKRLEESKPSHIDLVKAAIRNVFPIAWNADLGKQNMANQNTQSVDWSLCGLGLPPHGIQGGGDPGCNVCGKYACICKV